MKNLAPSCKLTTLFETAIKAHRFFLLDAEENVLLTLSDEPIVLPMVDKKRVGNYKALADMAAAAGEYDKAQDFENRALKLLPSVLERMNLHEFATQSVKHARVALAAAQGQRDFKLQGRLIQFIDLVAGRLSEGGVILEKQGWSKRPKMAGYEETQIINTDEFVSPVLSTDHMECSPISTEREGSDSSSNTMDVFQATAPSTFSRKRKLNEWRGDRSRTVSPKEKEKVPYSHKLSNADLVRILKHQKHPGTAGPLNLEGQSYRLEDPGSMSRPYCQACCKVVTKKHLRSHVITPTHEKNLAELNSGKSKIGRAHV